MLNVNEYVVSDHVFGSLQQARWGYIINIYTLCLLCKRRHRMEIEDKVKYLYSLKNQLSMFDRDLLAVPLEEKLKEKTYALEIWHDESYTLIRDCVRDFQKCTKSGMKDIRYYFIKKQQTEVATEESTEEEIVQ